ncbi:hypothetical protein H5T52_03225 [Candidatus Bipolaricaulota bacterium]|nr:hypothetical protein [Candidatus Bipolaricaulota bacterium]
MKIKIDLEQLIAAMEDARRDYNEYFLDRKTGEVEAIPEELLRAAGYEDWEETKKGLPGWEKPLAGLVEAIVLEEDPRWINVPFVPTHEVYELMANFAKSLEDEHLGELLDVALDGPGAFRRFKDVLARYPEQLERWYAFKSSYFERKARDWLEGLGIAWEPKP